MPKRKILIVEDEYIIAMDIERRCVEMGFAVVGIEASGEEAYEAVKKLKPDLILMDIYIKGNIDGIDVANKIHQTMDIPVVFITASTDVTTMERAKSTSSRGYIVKPIDENELNSVILSAI